MRHAELLDQDEPEREARTLEEAFVHVAKSQEPCVGCAHRQRCARFRLACDSFVGWVDTGRANNLERVPRAEPYAVLFPEDIQGKPE